MPGWIVAAALAGLAGLCGCGQKGPLYLPTGPASRPLAHVPGTPVDVATPAQPSSSMPAPASGAQSGR